MSEFSHLDENTMLATIVMNVIENLCSTKCTECTQNVLSNEYVQAVVESKQMF